MIAATLDILLGATMLMLLVLAVRKPVAQVFGAEWAYALWLLPVVVPFFPDLPSLTPEPVFTVLLPPVDGVAAPAAASGVAATSSGEWLLLLLALWGGGAAFFAIWQQSTYSAFMLHLGPQGRIAVPPSYGGIKVVESDAVEGPVALGIFRRRIVVPLDFATRYTAAEQRLALEHERVHHRRLDLVWNWVALGILTVNWFNPIAHFAFRAFRADQELACDAAVTRRAPGQRHDYACALVKSASHPGLIAVCPLNHASFLKRRLKMMKQHRASWARTIGGAASVALVGAAGLALATPGFAQEERRTGDVVANKPAGAMFISEAEIARLREKCGPSVAGRDSVVCNEEEAKDPEVRAIMNSVKKRVDAHVEKTVDRARIKETVEKSMKAVDRADIERSIAAARKTALLESELRGVEIPEQHERVRDAMRRAQERLGRIDMRRHEDSMRRGLEAARLAMVNIDIEAITRSAISSTEHGVRDIRIDFDEEDRADLEADLREARHEAAAEAAEARHEAAAEAAEARREAMREVRQAQRQLARDMRKHRRTMRHAPPPPPLPHPPLAPPPHAPHPAPPPPPLS